MALCLEMMREGMAENDTTKQMMAMMLCKQSQESAKNSDENGEGKDKNTDSADGQKKDDSAQAKPEQPKQQEDKDSSPSTPPPATNTASTGSLPSYQSQVPTSNAAVAAKTEEATTTAVPEPKTFEIDYGKVPDPIEKARLGYDETGKASENATPDRALPAGSTLLASSSAKGATDANGKGAAGGDAAANKKQDGQRNKNENHEGAAGGDAPKPANSEGGSGGSPLDSLMAMLNGNKQGDPNAPAGGFGIDIMGPGGASAGGGEPKSNIFEYASFRFQKAAHEEGRVKKNGNIPSAKSAQNDPQNADDGSKNILALKSQL